MTASQILSGRLDVLEGSRILSGLRREVDVPDNDPDFETFVLIDSETDNLPIGDARKLWSESALAALETDVGKARVWAMTAGEEALRSVVSRFSSV